MRLTDCLCYIAKTQYQKFETNIPRKRNCAASVPISTFICLWAIYIFPWLVCLFCCREICGTILGIYKSITDIWMWKLGLRPRNSFLAIHKWDFHCAVWACHAPGRSILCFWWWWVMTNWEGRVYGCPCSLQMILLCSSHTTGNNDKLTWAGRPSGCPAYRWPWLSANRASGSREIHHDTRPGFETPHHTTLRQRIYIGVYVSYSLRLYVEDVIFSTLHVYAESRSAYTQCISAHAQCFQNITHGLCSIGHGHSV